MTAEVIAYTSALENKNEMKMYIFEMNNNNKFTELRNEIYTIKIGMIICLIIIIIGMFIFFTSKPSTTQYIASIPQRPPDNTFS
jgi:hypothetical protein